MEQAAANQAGGVLLWEYVHTYVHKVLTNYSSKFSGRLLQNHVLCTDMATTLVTL